MGVFIFYACAQNSLLRSRSARLARPGGVPSPWHGPMLLSYFYSMQPCRVLHKVSSRDGCSMYGARCGQGYGRGYSSRSVDLAVELGEGQS